MLVPPTLEIPVGADVVDDGPMTTCEMVVTGAIVDGTFAVDGTTAVGVLWDDVPGVVLIVTDGTPATVEHKFSKARNENA